MEWERMEWTVWGCGLVCDASVETTNADAYNADDNCIKKMVDLRYFLFILRI